MKNRTCTKIKTKERQVAQKILAIIMLITLTMFQFIYVTCGIVSAVYEELETQSNNTNQKNVTFDAIFKADNENKHSIESIIKDGTQITFCINVENTGVLNDAKISIEKANFKMQQTNNQYIKNVDTENNEIELNQLIAGNQIEITVPIKFEKTEQMSKEYINKESIVKLTGNYKNAQNKEKAVKGEIKIRTSWTEEPEIVIDQEIEKYINLEGNKTLIQQKITSQIKESILVQSKEIETEVPEIQNTLPDKVDVLINGKQINEKEYTYNKQNKTITINNEQKNNEEEYKIIYQYPIKHEEEIPITLNTKMQAKLYTDKTIEKQERKQIQARKTTNNVSIKEEVTPSLYKGYLYAGVENTTTYKENLSIEISNLEQIEEIEIGKMNHYFLDENENRKNVNDSLYISGIKLNKSNIESILGENFEIQILNSENNQKMYNITKESNWEENGNINIKIEEMNPNIIKIIFNKPENIGTLNLQIDKYIKGNVGYSKEELKTFKGLENTKTILVSGEQITVNSTSKLEDTISEAKIEVSNSNLSTTEKNENVQIVTTLKSDSEKYNLYKNPYIEIKLPEELQKIEINSINILYGEELSVEKAIYNQQAKTIQMQFKGEQTQFKTELEEGIKIVISANLIFKKNIPSKQTQITMICRDDNTEQHEISTNLNLNSKYGVILYNGVHDYNEEKTTIETTEDSKIYGKLNIEGEAEQAIVHQAVINNYEIPISKISIVGNISQENVETQINNIITNKEDAKIYYSKQENATSTDKTWEENIENKEEIKSYKIELEQELEPTDVIDIAYKLDIPENVEQNARNKSRYKCNILL